MAVVSQNILMQNLHSGVTGCNDKERAKNGSCRIVKTVLGLEAGSCSCVEDADSNSLIYFFHELKKISFSYVPK